MIQPRCVYRFSNVKYYGARKGYIYTLHREGDYMEYTFTKDCNIYTCNVNSILASSLTLVESDVDLPTIDSHPEYFI